MKLTSFALALTLMSSAALASDVGVSVTIGQPGFYGQIDIGRTPQPAVIYAEPRIIYRRGPVLEPVYLRVPPGHERNWRQHCSRYDACGRPVYFVRDDWYRREYIERDRHERHGRHEDRHGHHDRDDDGRRWDHDRR